MTILVVLAVLVGSVAWSGNILLIPVSIVFPLLWSAARTRRQSVIVSFGYFLAASRGLPQAVSNFFAAELFVGLLLWFGASFAFVIVHAACWDCRQGSCRGAQASFGYLLVCMALAIPPFGITGWAHPVTAAGVLFPGWGWCGLMMMTLGLVLMTTRFWPAAASVMAGFWLWSILHLPATDLPLDWQGVDLKWGASLGRDSSVTRQLLLLSLVKHHAAGTVVVLPESTFGLWTPTIEHMWQRELRGSGITVVSGAAQISADGYDNVLRVIAEDGSRALYRQRMPVPVSMWQPWNVGLEGSGGAQAHFFANPVVSVGKETVAPLICYEQLILWPILQSMLYDPDLIVAVANGWWTDGTAIAQIQHSNSEAWALLFDVPIVFSSNHQGPTSDQEPGAAGAGATLK